MFVYIYYQHFIKPVRNLLSSTTPSRRLDDILTYLEAMFRGNCVWNIRQLVIIHLPQFQSVNLNILILHNIWRATVVTARFPIILLKDPILGKKNHTFLSLWQYELYYNKQKLQLASTPLIFIQFVLLNSSEYLAAAPSRGAVWYVNFIILSPGQYRHHSDTQD